MKKLLRIGHRGACGYFLENSISSFKIAIELGVDLIETDVQLTKDREPVLMHDKLIDRTTRGRGFVWDYTYNDLSKIDLKNEEKIPHLKELCELVSKEKTKLYVELVDFQSSEIVTELLLKYFSVEKFLIASFNQNTILKVKEINENIQTIVNLEGVPVSIEKMIEDCKCDNISLGFGAIDIDLIKKIQLYGKRVFVWTINDYREIKRAKKMKVDGIVSDFPDRI